MADSRGSIRKITADGVVTVLAGKATGSDSYGGADGVGSAARFNFPFGVAVDNAARFTQPTGVAVHSAGNLFVADVTTIRRITPAGAVTTIAGKAGSHASADGTGQHRAIRFGVCSGRGQQRQRLRGRHGI